jgi:hypothetical protein
MCGPGRAGEVVVMCSSGPTSGRSDEERLLAADVSDDPLHVLGLAHGVEVVFLVVVERRFLPHRPVEGYGSASMSTSYEW